MNFLLRQSQAAAAAPSSSSSSLSSISSSSSGHHHLPPTTPFIKVSSKGGSTLEGLISEDNKSISSVGHHHRTSDSSGTNHNGYDNGNPDLYGDNGGLLNSSNSDKNFAPLADKHVDVVEDEGWITIPFKKLPDDWDCASDMHGFRSLDRTFVFPGEQVHILACLSAAKQDSEIITPFKVAAMMHKNNVANGAKDQNGNSSDQESISGSQYTSASESFLRMEDHKRQTETLLQRFKESHFFARIAESGEQLWSKKCSPGDLHIDSVKNDEGSGSGSSINAIIDKCSFDARVSGGVARSSVKCCSLSNGDIVVLLQVNVGVDFVKDPILEILQFEKHHDQIRGLNSDIPIKEEHHPSAELLKWLLPVDNSHHPVNRTVSPSLINTSHKASFSASSGSPLFSLNHFRSYSMSSLPPNVTPSASASPSLSSSLKLFSLSKFTLLSLTAIQMTCFVFRSRMCLQLIYQTRCHYVIMYIDAITIILEEGCPAHLCQQFQLHVLKVELIMVCQIWR